jgi:hypothetical protein
MFSHISEVSVGHTISVGLLVSAHLRVYHTAEKGYVPIM